MEKIVFYARRNRESAHKELRLPDGKFKLPDAPRVGDWCEVVTDRERHVVGIVERVRWYFSCGNPGVVVLVYILQIDSETSEVDK